MAPTRNAVAAAFVSPAALGAPRVLLGAHVAATSRPRMRPRGAPVRALLDPGLAADAHAALAAHAAPAFHAAAPALQAAVLGAADHAGAGFALLADAAAAVGQAAGQTASDAGTSAVEAQKAGVWDMFVGVVETALIGLHDALVSAGVSNAYGITIILFTIGIKTITFPLNSAQMESTLKMQSMSPRLKKIQADYKDNPTVMNQMIAQLYKDEKINPLLGCLPALVQIPIWIALYRTVLNLAKENLLNESFLFLPSLQGPVTQTGGSLSTWLYPLVDGAPPIGWHDALCYLVLPVLLVVSQSVSQKLLQPEVQDPSSAQANAVLKFMPLLVGWFSLNVPAGLGVYWVTNNLVSTAQTLFFRNKFKADNPESALESGGASDPTALNGARPAQLQQKEGFVAKPKPSASSGTKAKRRRRR
jgi:YidC/Oxa1 family membrane protein insertase